MADFRDSKCLEINDRLAVLLPLIDEYSRSEAASKALAGVPSSKNGPAVPAAGPTVAPRRGPGRLRGSKSKTAGVSTTTAVKSSTGRTGSRVGQRKGSGKRGAQALALVAGQPDITIPEMAAKMGIKENYLYRVLPGLEREKKIRRDGRGWHPVS